MVPDQETPQEALRQAFSATHLGPETRARHLHSLRHRAASMPSAVPAAAAATAPRLRGLRLRLAAVASAVLLSLGGGAGVAVAATDALPGDGLYRVKLAVEQVELRLPADAETAVRRALEIAERRLAEVAALQELGRDEHIGQALARHENRLAMAGQEAAGDAVLEAAVQQAAERAVERLTELLEGGLPEEASDRARAAIEAARDRIAGQGEDTVEPRGDTERRPDTTPRQDTEHRPAPRQDATPRQDAERRPDAAPPQDTERPFEHRPIPEAQPGGETPPSPPGSRAPRGPRS